MRFTRSITISRCFGIAILVASVALIVLLSGGSAEATHNGKNHGPKEGRWWRRRERRRHAADERRHGNPHRKRRDSRAGQ